MNPQPFGCRQAIVRLAVILLMASCPQALLARTFKSGDEVRLREGHGLLLAVVNTTAPLSILTLQRKDATFGGEGMTKLPVGRNVRLIELPAGEYRWSRASFETGSAWFSSTLSMRRDASLTFKVEPGVINYAGDLDLEGSIFSRWYFINRTSRLAAGLLALEAEFPGIRSRHPLAWQGRSPDRFVELLDRSLGDMTPATAMEKARAKALEDPGKQADDRFKALVAELFAVNRVDRVLLNPSGTLLLLSERLGDKALVRVVDLDSYEHRVIFNSAVSVETLIWANDTTLLLGASSRTNLGAVFRFERQPSGAPTFEHVAIPGSGWFIGRIGDSGRHALYAYTNDRGETGVFRIDISGKRVESSQFNRSGRLDKGIDDWVGVLADGGGELRVAAVKVDDDLVIRHRLPGQKDWRDVRRLPGDDKLRLLGLDADGEHLYVLTDIDRDNTELALLSLATGEIVETVYAVPDVDITGAQFDGDRRLLSASYVSGGQVVFHHFGDAQHATLEPLRRALPGRSLVRYQVSRDGQRALVFAFSETDPGSYYLHDAGARRLEALLTAIEPFKTATARTSKVIATKSTDGLAIESYLTLPAVGSAPHPLVVMPHGGPIGVRDALTYDPEVQMLANRGYAVLRINYRGSAGFGKQFLERGRGAWGRQIEDDILSAVDAALASHPLDPARVALRGTSYGGYSTLMGLIRSPDRFRCGIAIAAVTDLPLLFVSSDWSLNEKLSERMQRTVGDPKTQLAMLEAASPDHLHEKLDKPLLLIHGADDRRVPIEHALRLRLLLAAGGRAPQWLSIAGAGHADFDLSARVHVEAAADALLTDCLRGGATKVAGL